MAESLKKQTKKGLYWKFAEQFSNYGIQFIIGIFMARLLSPSEFGITALPAVFMAVAGLFANGGFGQALIRKPDLKEEDLSTAYIYSMCVGVLCYLILFFASPWIADFYNTPVLKPLMRVTALGFIYGPIGTPQSVLLQRELNFKILAKVSVFVKILGGVVGIILAFIGLGVWSLVISGMVGGILSQIIMICIVKWYPKTGWSKDSFKYLWGYGNKMMASGLLDTLYNNITPVIVGKYYSTSDLGIYNRAQHYADMPSKNIHVVLRSVTFPALSKIQDDVPKMISYYRKMINTSAFVIFPLMILMAELARPLVILMITAKWEACIILLQLMCFSKMWYSVHALNLNILLVKGRSDLFFRLEIIKKVVGLTAISCALPFGLVTFCAVNIFVSIISIYINSWYTGRMYDFGFVKQMKDLAPILILSILTFLTVFALTFVISNMWIQLIVGGVIGLSIYIGGAFIFKFPELKEVRYLLSRN